MDTYIDEQMGRQVIVIDQYEGGKERGRRRGRGRETHPVSLSEPLISAISESVHAF